MYLQKASHGSVLADAGLGFVLNIGMRCCLCNARWARSIPCASIGCLNIGLAMGEVLRYQRLQNMAGMARLIVLSLPKKCS